MATPHIDAKKSDIAKTILLPGDPLRAKFIATTYLENVKQFNFTRNILGYTGSYKGREVSVMGTGMGMPSMGIYSYELIHFYGVENLIRIGSCGAYSEDLDLYDIVIAMGASTDSNYAYNFQLNGTYSALCSYDLLKKASQVADEKNIDYKVGNILSSDVFYSQIEDDWKNWQAMGILAVEMEAYALYANAQRAGVRALTILTVSDSLVTGQQTTSKERERSFNEMMEIALELV